MGLAFLVPAFLAGLLALGLPVWVHLRNRPKADTVDFPSLMFIERIPYRAVQRQQLRHRLLFALRALAIVLLVLAFARPFFGNTSPGGSARGDRDIVVLVDRSWSMGYEGRWEAAMAAVRDEVAALRAGDRLSLVAFDERSEVLVESQPAAALNDAVLAGLQPGVLGTEYAAGLRAAGRILADGTLPGSELVLVSDFQRVGASEGMDVRLPPSARLRPINVSPDLGADAGVNDLTIDRVAGSEGSADGVRVSARVTQQHGEGERRLPVVLRIDGVEVQRRSVTLPASGARRVEFDPVAAPVEVRIEVAIEADALAGDDTLYAVAAPGETLTVMLLDNPGSGGGDSLYLQRALAVANRPVFRVDHQVLRDLRAPDLVDADLVILNDAGPLDAGSATALADYVRAGGGLIVGVAELAETGNTGVLPVAVGDTVDRSAALGASLGFVDTAHPVFELFRGPDAGDLSRARFYRYRALQPAPSDGVLARFDDGAPALVQLDMGGTGRALLWTTSFDTFWTDLPLQPIFVPLAVELAKFASGYREAAPWATATADRSPGFHPAGTEDGASVAVNLDRREADLTPLDPEELLASVAWGSGAEVAAEADATLDPARVEAAQSTWWYFVVVAMALLLAESSLSNRMSLRASWSAPETISSPEARHDA